MKRFKLLFVSLVSSPIAVFGATEVETPFQLSELIIKNSILIGLMVVAFLCAVAFCVALGVRLYEGILAKADAHAKE